MSDTTCLITTPDGYFRVSRKHVELPDIQGYVYTVYEPPRPATPRYSGARLCVPFTLPPPSTELWPRLQQVGLHHPARLHEAIVGAVSEWALAQAVVSRAGVSGRATSEVHPFPVDQSITFLLKYAYSVMEFDDAMEAWPVCGVCEEWFASHVDGRCNLELGQSFATSCPTHLGNIQRIIAFNNALPGWLEACVDAIYAMALERLNAKQKTSPFTYDSAGREFTPYVADVSTRLAGTTGDGAGHPVSGEPGDNGNR